MECSPARQFVLPEHHLSNPTDNGQLAGDTSPFSRFGLVLIRANLLYCERLQGSDRDDSRPGTDKLRPDTDRLR